MSRPPASTRSPANRSATAFPIPFAPPVTTTVLTAAPSGRAPGRRLREVVDDPHLARDLVRRETLANEVLERGLVDRATRDDEGAGQRQPVVLRADDGGLDDLRMLDEAVLDLGRRDPDPADLDQIVDAPPIPEVAVLVALEESPVLTRVAVERLLRLLVLAPVEERGGVALDPQLAVLGDVALVAGDEPVNRRARPAGWRCRCGTPRTSRSRPAPRRRTSRAGGRAALSGALRPPKCRSAGRRGRARDARAFGPSSSER